MSRRSEAERVEQERIAELRAAQSAKPTAEHKGIWSEPATNAPSAPRADAPTFDLCIYHKDCMDGFTAAWAVRKRFPRIEMVAAAYGDAPPNVSGRRVVCVDFSYPRAVLDSMASAADHVLVIDHHRTAFEALANVACAAGSIDDFLPRRLSAIFQEDHSGAGLTWRFFHSGAAAPNLVAYVEDRDLWRFRFPYSREVNAAIGAIVFDFAAYDGLARRLETSSGLGAAMIGGEAILDHLSKQHREMVALATRRMRIGGIIAPVVNLPPMWASDALHVLAWRQHAGTPFVASYFDRADGRRQFSLRSLDDGADVAQIAARYGGGGHVHAAGFLAPCGWEGDDAPDAG